jgi:hypothetical protein
MCPVYDYNNNKCRVTPEDYNATCDRSDADYKCKDSYNYKKCGNYESYESGRYRIER